MKITKFGHSCLLIEEGRARILIDPGNYSKIPDGLNNLDAILITHEHDDHCFIESLKKALIDNPGVKVYTNSGAAQKLAKHGIKFALLEAGQAAKVNGVLVEGFGKNHAVIYPTMPRLVNVGYRIAEKFFYGGDSIEVPGETIEVLAFPAIAPWLKSSEAVDFAKAIKPKICFPVHDAFLTSITGGFYKMPERELGDVGIKWLVPEIGHSFVV